ncbi:MAG: hypothetical protein WDO13_09545 [Verrucomicrobiota bacterium]
MRPSARLITPDAGELLFTTDNKQLFVGDGATAGGLLLSGATRRRLRAEVRRHGDDRPRAWTR